MHAKISRIKTVDGIVPNLHKDSKEWRLKRGHWIGNEIYGMFSESIFEIN